MASLDYLCERDVKGTLAAHQSCDELSQCPVRHSARTGEICDFRLFSDICCLDIGVNVE